MKAQDLIPYAYEESRYHRQFHHTLFSIYFTLYLALLGFQLSEFETVQKVAGINWLKWPVVIVLYAGLPIWLTTVFFSYHDTIARLNNIIANATGNDVSGIERRAFNILTFQKYRGITADSSTAAIGRGHWFFLINLWVLAAFNFYVSWVIYTQVS